MFFTILPTAAVVVAVWAGATGGPHPPMDAMPELRKSPKPPLHQETSVSGAGREETRNGRFSAPHRR